MVQPNTMQRQQHNEQTIKNLMDAINGEYSAIYCYELLANQAPNDEIKNQILEIRKDEIRHYETFWNHYVSLTGQTMQPQITETCPGNYSDGIKAAFLDEQKTVDFYHDAARETSNASIKDAFMQAAADEQNHAVWFLYFMHENKS